MASPKVTKLLAQSLALPAGQGLFHSPDPRLSRLPRSASPIAPRHCSSLQPESWTPQRPPPTAEMHRRRGGPQRSEAQTPLGHPQCTLCPSRGSDPPGGLSGLSPEPMTCGRTLSKGHSTDWDGIAPGRGHAGCTPWPGGCCCCLAALSSRAELTVLFVLIPAAGKRR